MDPSRVSPAPLPWGHSCLSGSKSQPTLFCLMPLWGPTLTLDTGKGLC